MGANLRTRLSTDAPRIYHQNDLKFACQGILPKKFAVYCTDDSLYIIISVNSDSSGNRLVHNSNFNYSFKKMSVNVCECVT